MGYLTLKVAIVLLILFKLVKREEPYGLNVIYIQHYACFQLTKGCKLVHNEFCMNEQDSINYFTIDKGMKTYTICF